MKKNHSHHTCCVGFLSIEYLKLMRTDGNGLNKSEDHNMQLKERIFSFDLELRVMICLLLFFHFLFMGLGRWNKV